MAVLNTPSLLRWSVSASKTVLLLPVRVVRDGRHPVGRVDEATRLAWKWPGTVAAFTPVMVLANQPSRCRYLLN